MNELKIVSKSITKWGDRRGEWVTTNEASPGWWICKEGKIDSGTGTCGYGNTEKMAIENYVWRKHYFDGGREKYMPYEEKK